MLTHILCIIYRGFMQLCDWKNKWINADHLGILPDIRIWKWWHRLHLHAEPVLCGDVRGMSESIY